MKATYEANDKAFQFLIMSRSGIEFGLVNQAKTATLKDGDAYLAWKNLCACYAPHEVSDYISIDANLRQLEQTQKLGSSNLKLYGARCKEMI